jgi:AcrR family transcriptional regulator
MSQDKSKARQAMRKLSEEGLKLLAALGLSGCKVEDITAAAGVGKGTFFNYFGSKDLFVAKLVENSLADLDRRLSPLSFSTAPPEQFLASMGGVYLRYFQVRPEVAAVLIQALNLPADSKAGQMVKEALNAHLDKAAELARAVSLQVGWGDNTRELVLSLLSLSFGFFWLGRGLVTPPGHLLERLSKVLARGLSQNVQARDGSPQ